MSILDDKGVFIMTEVSYKYTDKTGAFGSKSIKTSKGDSINILFENGTEKGLKYKYSFVGNSINARDIVINILDSETGANKGQIKVKDAVKNKLKGLKFTATVTGGKEENNVAFDFVNSDRLQTHYSVAPSYKGKKTVTYTGTTFCEEIASTRINDTIKIGSGKTNVIFGGEGNDKIYGGKGSDIFVFGTSTENFSLAKQMTDLYYNEYDSAGKERPQYKGDGYDTIYNATSADKLLFSEADETSLSFYRTGNNLIIYSDDDKKNKVTLSGFFSSKNKLDEIFFGESDPSTDEPDFSIKNDVSNIVFTGKGKMNGSEYNEKIIGSSKKDTITTGSGEDNIYAGAGNDKITLNTGGAKIVHFSGYESPKYHDDDYDTTKSIKEGNDTIYINKNSEGKYVDTTLVFDGRVNPVTFGASTNGKDLIITHQDDNFEKNGTITIKDYFTNYNPEYISTNEDIKVNTEVNTEGIELNTLINNVLISGKSNKKNTIRGTRYTDTINGGKKADTIYTGIGADAINAGKGNDKIHLDGAGNKTINLIKGSGKDTLYIDSNDVDSVYLKFDTGAVNSFSSNGVDLTINAKYTSGKKSVTDKLTIKNGLNSVDKFTIAGSALEVSKISITGVYNKKGKSYTFTGTDYDDVVNGTNKKDFIEVYGGNNIINVGKKGLTDISAGIGDDTYNVKNLTAKVSIHDKAGDDTLNLTGNKYSDLNFFFNVLKNDEVINVDDKNMLTKDLYIVNKSTMDSMSKGKVKLPSTGVLIEEYFYADETTDGKIENITVKDKGEISELLESSVSKIKDAVVEYLSGTSYNSAYELMEKGTKTEKKNLISYYTSNKVNSTELLPGNNINSLKSEVAAWKSSSADITELAIPDANDTVNIPALVAQYS